MSNLLEDIAVGVRLFHKMGADWRTPVDGRYNVPDEVIKMVNLLNTVLKSYEFPKVEVQLLSNITLVEGKLNLWAYSPFMTDCYRSSRTDPALGSIVIPLAILTTPDPVFEALRDYVSRVSAECYQHIDDAHATIKASYDRIIEVREKLAVATANAGL